MTALRGLTGIDHGMCINLDRRPDRWAGFNARLPEALGALVERWSAHDGRQLSMTAEISRLFAHNDFQWRRNIVGCSLSHLRLWQLLASKNYPYDRTVIFEDDAWFAKSFVAIWNDKIASVLPAEFDLLYLGGLPGPAMLNEMAATMRRHDGNIPIAADVYTRERLNSALIIPRQMQFCTYSYVISRQGAEKLCRMAERDGFRRSIDWFIIDRWSEMTVYATDPVMCWSVFQEGSDILLDYDIIQGAGETAAHA